MLTELKVKKAIKGDDNSFLELIKPQKEQLYKIAYSYVKNEQDALDIIQETICKAYVSLDKLEKPRYFKTWLIKILINVSITTLNKNKKITYMKQVDIYDSVSTLECDSKIDLVDEINRLDKKYKDVIRLKFYNDLTIKEISQVLNIPIGTARTNLYRGLEVLKKSMKERSK